MGNVTAHFDFSGGFWLVVLLAVAGALSFVWRDEIKLVFQRMRDQAEANRGTT